MWVGPWPDVVCIWQHQFPGYEILMYCPVHTYRMERLKMWLHVVYFYAWLHPTFAASQRGLKAVFKPAGLALILMKGQ